MKISNQCNKFIIGTAQFGLKYGITNKTGKIEHKEATNILKTCFKNDIKMFDTAKSYGTSEARLGKISSGNIDFITKISGNNYIEQVKDSIQKLNVDILHGVLMHAEQEILLYEKQRELLKLKQANLCEKIGISLYDFSILEKLRNTKFLDNVDIIQVPLNILSVTEYKINILEELKNKNVEIHVRSVFLQGILLMKNYNNLPSHFNEFKDQLLMWDEYINSNNLNKLDICLSSILNLSCVDKVVLGIDSNAQLLDLVNYNHIFNYPAMNIKNISENLTNPTKWSI